MKKMFCKLRKYLNDRSQKIMQKTMQINHRGHQFSFHVPNHICRYRAKTFASKEPETLAWIDSFEEGVVFWDVGANIGLYSIYAAATRNARTFAFEPSVFNLELLARNVFLNNLHNEICLVPMALNNKAGANQFRLQGTEWGGALSSFDHPIDHTGAPIKTIFQYGTIGLTMDDINRMFSISLPDYLKIDVDGIEHLLLEKADTVLCKCRGLLIEYSGQWNEQSSTIEKILQQYGFHKTFTQDYDPMTNPNGSMNTIWSKTS